MEILHVFSFHTDSYGECFFAFISKKEVNGEGDMLVLREISGNDYKKVQSRRLESLIR